MINDPRLTPEMVESGKKKLKFISTAFKQVIQAMLGDDYDFVVLIRHKTAEKTMLIVGDVDSHEELGEIITEAYQRHNTPDMHKMDDDDLNAPAHKH